MPGLFAGRLVWMYSHAACVYQEVSLSDNSCFSRFAQKDFKITFVAWN